MNVTVIDAAGVNPKALAEKAGDKIRKMPGASDVEVSGTEVSAQVVKGGKKMLQRVGFVPKGDKIAIVTVAGPVDSEDEVEALFAKSVSSVQ